MFCCCAVSVVCGGHLAAVSEVVQRSKHGRGSARIMRNSRFEPETAGDGEMNGGAHGTTYRESHDRASREW